MSLMCEPLKGGSESDNVGIDQMYPDHTRIIYVDIGNDSDYLSSNNIIVYQCYD